MPASMSKGRDSGSEFDSYDLDTYATSYSLSPGGSWPCHTDMPTESFFLSLGICTDLLLSRQAQQLNQSHFHGSPLHGAQSSSDTAFIFPDVLTSSFNCFMAAEIISCTFTDPE